MTAFHSNNLVPVQKGTLSLACFNLYCAPSKPDSKKRMEQVAKRVLPAWHREGIDLVGAQEVFGPAEALCDSDNYRHVAHAREKTSFLHVAHSGLAVLSRHPISAKKFQPFQKKCAWTRFSTAGLLMVDADFPGFGRVRVINTHLQSSFSPADPLQNHDIRLHQIKKDLAGLVKNTRDRESLCVVMGDLNHHPVDPATGQVTAEYDYLVHGLHLADVTTAIARHRGLAEEAIFTFGPNIFYAERSYADAGFRLLFDRIHVGTTNPNHIVVVDLDESSIAFEDTFSSDHKAVKIRLSLSVYDLGPSAAINLGARVLYSSAKQSFDFANPLGRLAA